MIRQDESSRRASALVFLDNAEHALGQGTAPAFERAVSAAATLGVLLSPAGSRSGSPRPRRPRPR